MHRRTAAAAAALGSCSAGLSRSCLTRARACGCVPYPLQPTDYVGGAAQEDGHVEVPLPGQVATAAPVYD